jgi:hypothetical protein
MIFGRYEAKQDPLFSHSQPEVARRRMCPRPRVHRPSAGGHPVSRRMDQRLDDHLPRRNDGHYLQDRGSEEGRGGGSPEADGAHFAADAGGPFGCRAPCRRALGRHGRGRPPVTAALDAGRWLCWLLPPTRSAPAKRHGWRRRVRHTVSATDGWSEPVTGAPLSVRGRPAAWARARCRRSGHHTSSTARSRR